MVVQSPGLHKFLLNSVDVTAQIISSKITKSYNQPVKTLRMSINRNVNSLITIDNSVLGKEITISRGVLASTERYIFRGEITSFTIQGSVYEVTASDKLYVAARREYDYTFNINTDPEAGVGSAIVENLFTLLGLSYTSGTTVLSTGTDATLTLITYPIKGSVINSLKDLAKIYNYQLFYRDSDDKNYFIPIGYTSTSTVLTTGVDIRNRIQWLTSAVDMKNNITLVGGQQLDWNTETFAGPATTITLGAIPVDTDAYVNTSTKVLRGVNSNDPKDFYVNGKDLVFTVSSSNIVVNYSYNVPTKVLATNYDSIDSYNQRDTTIINSRLTNSSDTELRANNYLDSSSEPLTSAPLQVIGNNDLELGQEITVIDTINNTTRSVVVTAINYSYPYAFDEVTVGKKTVQLIDLQVNIVDSIVKLQRQLSSESDINTQLFTFPQEVDMYSYTSISTAGMDAGVLYWDSDTQGTWDDFDWGDATDETYTVTALINSNNVAYEDFYTPLFKNVASTCTWLASGYASFIDGQTAISKYMFYDSVDLITAVTLTATLTGTLVFEISCDGTNWEIIANNTTHTMTNTGHYLYWRATSTGVSTLNTVNLKYVI